MTHVHAKGQGQRWLVRKECKQMDGSIDRWTEAIALPTMLSWSVIII